MEALQKGLSNVGVIRRFCPPFAILHVIPFILQLASGGQHYSYLFCAITIISQSTFCLLMVWLCYSEYQTVRDSKSSIKEGFLVKSPVMTSSARLFQAQSNHWTNRISL